MSSEFLKISNLDALRPDSSSLNPCFDLNCFDLNEIFWNSSEEDYVFEDFDSLEDVIKDEDGMCHLIEEMEEFLSGDSTSSSSSSLFDELSESNQNNFNNSNKQKKNNSRKESSQISTSSANITNVSEYISENGQNIIIMIASPDSLKCRDGDLSSNSSSPSHSDDSEWFPKSSLKRRQGRNVKSSILDKKERKKWQNVEAARRYRDKKKIEHTECEIEVKMLEDKNMTLKRKISEMESEMKTLKKLMSELGIIKLQSLPSSNNIK